MSYVSLRSIFILGEVDLRGSIEINIHECDILNISDTSERILLNTLPSPKLIAD